MRVMQEPYNVLRWLVLSVFCQSLMLLLPFAQGIKPTVVAGCIDTNVSASANDGPTAARSSRETKSN
jgi:hypothetical protein